MNRFDQEVIQAAVAYVKDSQNSISSLREYPLTQEARMEVRMRLRGDLHRAVEKWIEADPSHPSES